MKCSDCMYKIAPLPDFTRAERSFVKTMQGTVGTEDRWRTCVLATNAAMGFAIAPVFVDRAFSPQSRDIALGMFAEIKGAFSGMQYLPTFRRIDFYSSSCR